jgi:hypothetical protein
MDSLLFLVNMLPGTWRMGISLDLYITTKRGSAARLNTGYGDSEWFTYGFSLFVESFGGDLISPAYGWHADLLQSGLSTLGRHHGLRQYEYGPYIDRFYPPTEVVPVLGYLYGDKGIIVGGSAVGTAITSAP